MCVNVDGGFLHQRPEKLNEKPSVLPAVEVIAPGGSYNPDFFSHQVTQNAKYMTSQATCMLLKWYQSIYTLCTFSDFKVRTSSMVVIVLLEGESPAWSGVL